MPARTKIYRTKKKSHTDNENEFYTVYGIFPTPSMLTQYLKNRQPKKLMLATYWRNRNKKIRVKTI